MLRIVGNNGNQKDMCYDEDEIDVAQNISDAILGSFISCNSRFTSKVCGPYVVTCLDWTPTFGWHMARFTVNNLAPKSYVLLFAQKCSTIRHHSRFNC